MPNETSHQPRNIPQVMVSSTFKDLEAHREALIKVIKAYGLTEAAMENDSAKLADVIESSLDKVRDSAAYVAIIGKRYGQIPKCPERNPEGLSITELEFNEALQLKRPILLFIMAKDHLVHEDHIEKNARNKKKLQVFIERAKKSANSEVHRIFAEFKDLEQFKERIGPSIAELRRFLERHGDGPDPDPIPKPPEFYAEPRYIVSQEFVGRELQLKVLSNWAMPSDPHSILLFEAIGGNGKSMLTWEWTTKHATQVRNDWAGRFWYSFYEKGAVMSDFCQRALAYMTESPLKAFHGIKTPELSERLLHYLQERPWLFVLDGLERVLVAYHRIDAAEIPDEEVNKPTDKIVHRDPCSAIRPEDDDLLRALASAAPSKLLISSRLVPLALLNRANQPIPSVLPINLPGLLPPDAERLLRSFGITGSSHAIQNYLETHCKCHPLVIGVLAGLINDYLPDRGNFDAWAADQSGGNHLNLANLDIVQKRNHILKAGLEALPEKSRQLLSTLALLPEAVDYTTLRAFNPHLPPAPERVEEPTKPEESWRWDHMSEEEKTEARRQYEAGGVRRKEYEQAVKARLESPEFLAAPQELEKTVRDLARRGLIQYDSRIKRYDLHPVVRGVAAGGLRTKEKEEYGQRVVDYFSQQPHNPYEQARTLEDVRAGLNAVRTLINIGHFQQAADVYKHDLANALFYNLEAYSELLSLLRPFFPVSWGKLIGELDKPDACILTKDAGIALRHSGHLGESLGALAATVWASLEIQAFHHLQASLRVIFWNLTDQNLLAKAARVLALHLDMSKVIDDKESLFLGLVRLFVSQAKTGQWTDAEATWRLLDPMGRDWSRYGYRPGDAEWRYAEAQFWKGVLEEEHLTVALGIASEGSNHFAIRDLHRLRGAWQMEQGKWVQAVASLQEAVRMARERSLPDAESETGLALAKFHLGQLAEPNREAERLALLCQPAQRLLAMLWLALGETALAKKHALAAYKWAWADGEPYVNRYDLTKTTELLQQMNIPIPVLPPYNRAKDEPFPWETAVRAAIEKLHAEKEAKEKAEKRKSN